MPVAVREDDEAAVLRTGIFTGLFLADQRVLIFRFGLKDDEREPSGVKQQEVDQPSACLLEIVAKGVQVGLFDRDAWFEADVGGFAPFGEETPPRGFEQLVDLDPGSGFLHVLPKRLFTLYL